METLIITLVICVINIIFGKILTENSSLSLVHFSKKLDRKPFNCRPCLTFHLQWIQYTVYAIIENSYSIFIVGIIISFAVFVVLERRNRSKIIK